MSSITLTSIALGQVPIANQNVNVKYRLTSDPDVAASYTDLGFFVVKPNGDFVTPVVIGSLTLGASYTVWVINPCANSSYTRAFAMPPPYYSVSKSGTATRNNCATGGTGSLVTYTVLAGAYISTVSQADADAQAQADVDANKQAYANANGTCTFVSVSKSGTATRNNCATGGTGSLVTYTVLAGAYSSIISQADADAQAQADVDANKQAYANTNGICTWHNVLASQLFTKNDCTTGFDGTTVNYIVAANAYSSTISQADADAQAAADIAANGQTYANTNGACVSTSVVATLLVDYYADSAADLCMYCSTPGVSEVNQFVAPTADGGPMQLPNDGSDPAVCYLLSSDKIVGPPVRRFGINLAYFINKYPAIDHFTFVLRGRSASAAAVSGIFAKRNISLGHLIVVPASGGGVIPSVSGATTADIVSYSSNVTAGTDGTVGVGVGSPVLTLDYIVSTDTMTPTTY